MTVWIAFGVYRKVDAGETRLRCNARGGSQQPGSMPHSTGGGMDPKIHELWQPRAVGGIRPVRASHGRDTFAKPHDLARCLHDKVTRYA